MQLSLKLYEQLNSLLCAEAVTGRQQRSEPRVGVRMRQQIVPNIVGDAGTRPIDVWIRDISLTGLGFSANQPLGQGTQFLIRLTSSSGSKVAIRYSIAHCVCVAPGVYVAGAKVDRVFCTECACLQGMMDRIASLVVTPAA
ncbi:PilZ domain-containing protein [Humisphaera borealis]|uniref:PilZ domain-containing protein n=2 Tax=Humisphaera borealis TaxID=2807512 RepID=A0A7M2WQ26_9BACT|nr:PilZ domain-containing protein [Humisphaera borealis]